MVTSIEKKKSTQNNEKDITLVLFECIILHMYVFVRHFYSHGNKIPQGCRQQTFRLDKIAPEASVHWESLAKFNFVIVGILGFMGTRFHY